MNREKGFISTEAKKIKVLAYCDTPSCATGFGTVSRNILSGLYNTGRFDIEILGINYWGNPHPFPFNIWPVGTNSENDPFGRKKVCNMIPNMDFDVLFFLQDTFILDFLPELIQFLKQTREKKFASICYYPIDGVPKEQWIKNVNVVDYPVAYCEFGKKMSQKVFKECKDLRVIPHGVNTRTFYPLPESRIKSFKEQYFNKNVEKFVFTNLNRNQQRKDIPRTIAAFVEFRKKVKDAILYLHCAKVDQGWNLPEVCASYGLSIVDDVLFPENFGPNQGFPLEIVNMVYNISDCVVSTALGEGFGLSWPEAMATKTPVIMPNNTAMAEFITEDKGFLSDSGTNSSLFTVLPHDNEVVRPLVDVDDLAEKMLYVYSNYGEAKKKADNAYSWAVTQMDWQNSIVPHWVKLFDEAYESIQSNIILPDQHKIIKAEEF
jgi:glycosyltransferase involved in cell wall biosynthesis